MMNGVLAGRLRGGVNGSAMGRGGDLVVLAILMVA